MAKHGKTTFQDSWFMDPDFKTWLKKPKGDHYSAECILCPGTKISISSMGRRALSSHMLGQKHKIKADAMNKSPAVSMFFQSGNGCKLGRPSSEANASKMPSRPTSMPSTSAAGIQSASSDIPSTSSSSGLPITPSLPDNDNKNTLCGLKKYVLSDNVTKAKILWCLQTVMSHKSMNSAENNVNLLKLMFPDSDIAKKI